MGEAESSIVTLAKQNHWMVPVQPGTAKPPWNEVPSWMNEHPWTAALTHLEKKGVCTATELNDPTTMLFIAPHIGLWVQAMHWVHRKTWDEKHKIPGRRNDRKKAEPLGDLFVAVRELCKELHFGADTIYPNAADWFCAVVYEWLLVRLAGVLELSRQEDRPKRTKPEAINETRRTFVAPLKDFENPFPPERRHLHCLIDRAISAAETNQTFNRNYYQPFLRACEKWVKTIQEDPDFTAHWIDGDDIYFQDGQGRSVKKLAL